MTKLELQRNVQFLYEDQLAKIELRALGCDECRRDDDNPWLLSAQVNGNVAELVRRSAYLGAVDGCATVYGELIRPNYQGGHFNRTRSVNQYLTHWIYPYQGKFHPQMVRALLNILGVGPGSRVCEPYLGSGTAALEASLLGADVVGVDMSPLCAMLTRVKTRSFRAAPRIRTRVEALLASSDVGLDDLRSTDDEVVDEFLMIARMVTLSDVARRKRNAAVYVRKNLLAMLDSVESHARAVEHFDLTPGDVQAGVGDCRDLAASGVADSSIDGIVTSPPYSIALDYVKNDEHALDDMGVDADALRSTMTGVRGKGPAQKLALYNADMQAMFKEVRRVLKPGAQAAFVIGDATVDGREYTTTEQMSDWAVAAGLHLQRRLPKIVFGLYNVMKDEKIMIFCRPA